MIQFAGIARVRWREMFSAALAAVLIGTLPFPVAAQSALCPSPRSKIDGGAPASLADWPGQASLRFQATSGHISVYFCGCSAITDRWILTAAHCLADHTNSLGAVIEDSQ